MLSPTLTQPFENELLDIIDNADEFSRSDLQGVVSVLVNKIMEAGYQELSKTNSEDNHTT